MTQNTADTTHINLICEDRQTGKKCQFNDLAIVPLPDGHIRLGDLISSHISLHYFLSNSMIFQHTPEIDIVLGFYPSAELSTLALPVSTSAAGISTLSFKFEKIPTYSSDSEPSQVLNQNQIRSNKIINFPNQSLGKQPSFNLLPVKTQEAHLPLSSKISLPQTESKSTASSASQEDECLGSTEEREYDGRKVENLNGEENNSKIKCEEQQICSEGNDKMHGSDENKEFDSLEAQEELLQDNPSEEEKGSSSSSSLNRKRKTSEALDCSKSCSPCTSYTENDQQDKIQQPPLLKKKQKTTATSNIDFSTAQNSNQTNNFSYLPTKTLSSFGVNSSFNVYNPISTTSGIKLGDFSQQQQAGMTYSQAQQFQQIQQSSSNILLNNSCNGSSRQSRNKERTIKEAIEMVTKWRDLQEEYRQKHQVKGLQEVADELNISKKVLDYYFQELRTAEFFGFDFDSNLSSKMGVLRKFIDEQKKNHENKNKNFKITRNLQFRYRLKDDGSNFMNMGSAASMASSSSGIENQNINVHQSKMNQKNSCNEELNNNLFQTNMVISRLLRPSNTINNSADSSSNQDDSPNKKINGVENFSNILSNQNQTVPSCSSFQEVLSKNSPLFLSFFNTHNTTCQSSFTPSIVKPTFNGGQQQQSTQELIQKSLSQQSEQPKQQLKSQKQQSYPSQLLLNPQTSAASSSTKSSSFISQNSKNSLPTLPRKSSSSQQLQQTTQQLAGLDKALLLLELLNQTTQQSQTPLLNTNQPASTNVTESSKSNTNANNNNNNFSNPSNNLFDDVFNLMKLLSPSTEEPKMSTDSQDKKVNPAQKVAQSPFLLAAKNSNSPSDQGSFSESHEHRLEDVLEVKQIQNE